ncbi:MAG: O-methyltransferase [Bacteroidota bacterium]
MNFVPAQIENYCNLFSNPETDLLKNINEQTNLNVHSPHMLSGQLQGNLLQFISLIKQPANILEIGTYTGYSAICLAKGLPPNGKLITIEQNKELENRILESFAAHPQKDQLNLVVGNALEIIPTINIKFDLVFIDADKRNYTNYYNLVFPMLTKGGIIIADNVLWKGKVLDNTESMDKQTLALHQFNRMVFEDERVFNFILPIRDGISIAIKK